MSRPGVVHQHPASEPVAVSSTALTIAVIGTAATAQLVVKAPVVRAAEIAMVADAKGRHLRPNTSIVMFPAVEPDLAHALYLPDARLPAADRV